MEKRKLPPLKEFLETLYGRKLEDPKPWTPEYKEKLLEVVRKDRENRNNIPLYQDGQEDI